MLLVLSFRADPDEQKDPSVDGPVGREGFEPPKRNASGLQPDPFGHSGISPGSRRWDSNPQPAVYKTAALPIELRRQHIRNPTRDCTVHTGTCQCAESRASRDGPSSSGRSYTAAHATSRNLPGRLRNGTTPSGVSNEQAWARVGAGVVHPTFAPGNGETDRRHRYTLLWLCSEGARCSPSRQVLDCDHRRQHADGIAAEPTGHHC